MRFPGAFRRSSDPSATLTVASSPRSAAIVAQEGGGVDRLRQVAVAAGRQAALAVAAHGVRGDRDHRHRGEGGVDAERGDQVEPRARRGDSCRGGRRPAEPDRDRLRTARRAPAARRRSRRAPPSSPPRRAGTRPARSSGRCLQPPTAQCVPAPRPAAPLRLRRDSSSRSTAGPAAAGRPAPCDSSAPTCGPRAARGLRVVSSFEVNTTIGMRAVSGSAWSSAATRKPSMPSIDQVEHDDRGHRARGELEAVRAARRREHLVAGFFELERQVVVDLRVVVDHQHARRRAGASAGTSSRSRSRKALAVERLDEVVVGAEREAELVVGDQADDDHRDGGRRRRRP